MASSSKPYLLFFTIFLSTFVVSVDMEFLGFTVDLIHRDSPKSPFFDNTTTPYEKFDNAVRRSNNRRGNNFFFPNAETKDDDPESELPYLEGDYLMSFAIGIPRYETFASIDTGSSLTWLQCTPCNLCYPQNQELFDPTSSFYHDQPDCFSGTCIRVASSVTRAGCDEDCLCVYSLTYEDGSTSKGHIYRDKLTLKTASGGNKIVSGFIYGCGRQNEGIFDNPWSTGIVGLGRGRVSLVGQIFADIQGKFAHCLDDLGQTGKLMFGQHAVIDGSDVVSTRMATHMLAFEEDYFVTLAAISVGSEQINVTPVEEANMVLDVGATLTYLPHHYLSWLEAHLQAHLDLTYQSVTHPRNTFNICYLIQTVEELEIPPVSFHFNDGGSITLDAIHLFRNVVDDITCLVLHPSDSQEFVFGAVSSVDLVIEYDLANERVYFKKTECNRI